MRNSEFGMRNAEPDRVETGAGWRRGMLALCMIVGAAVMVQGAARLPCISRDGVFFVEYAEKLAVEPLVQLRGQTKQPGYSILLLGLHSLIGRSISENAAVSWEVCGQIIAVLGGVAVVGLIYLLTRRLFDARTALVAALLAAFWPQLVSVSSDVLSDAPHLALYLGGLLLGVRAMGQTNRRIEENLNHRGTEAQRTRWRSLVACGAVCGLAYWMRQEALGAVAAVVVCLLWPAARVVLSRRVARVGVVVAAFVIVVAPYSIAVGKVMPNKSIKDLFWGTEETESADGADGRRWWENAECGMQNAEWKNREVHQRTQVAGPVTWWDAPIKMLGGWSRSGRYVLSTLALVGFFWPGSARSDRAVRRLVVIAALLQVIAAQARGMQYGVVSERYLMIPAALAIPWAAAGLVAVALWMAERMANSEGRIAKGEARAMREAEALGRLRSAGAPATTGRRPLLVAALIAIGPMAYYDLRPAKEGADWQREAGAWIAGQAAKGDVVLAAPQRSPVAFYAGLERRWPVSEGIAVAMRPVNRAQVWVVDDPEMSRATEIEKSLLADFRRHKSADAPLRTWRKEEEGEVLVYKLRKS
ncbi:MAG TPA: glycosyltransferase family 39 protein [Phycisphaerae bacterium]|nr:glycosyltransferase family 39 protein [Phycisphaerae bacterium]